MVMYYSVRVDSSAMTSACLGVCPPFKEVIVWQCTQHLRGKCVATRPAGSSAVTFQLWAQSNAVSHCSAIVLTPVLFLQAMLKMELVMGSGHH
jgi:hypothetical protein